MADTEREIETAFEGLRREVRGVAARPPVGEIVRRGRRRRKVRAATTLVASAVAVAGIFGGQTVAGRLTHPRHTVTGRLENLRVTDLVYGSAARKDPAHWGPIQPIKPNGPTTDPAVPVCGRDATQAWGDKGAAASATGYDLTYTPGLDRADSDSQRGEQVMVLRTTARARRVMSLILTYARACGNTVTIGRPSIGDGALDLRHSYQREGDGVPVVEEAVAVRQGNAVAIYWDYRRSEMPALTTMARHEADARTMAKRLRGRGFGG